MPQHRTRQLFSAGWRAVREAGPQRLVFTALLVVMALLLSRFSWDLPITNYAERSLYDVRAYVQAEKVEQDLCAQLPQDQWIDGGHRLLLLGRYVCLAKSPDCADCPVFELCPSRQGVALGDWQTRAKHTQDRIAAGGKGPGGGAAG